MASYQYTSPRTGATYTGFAVSSGRRAAAQYRHAMSYQAAATALGGRERRTVANNTVLYRVSDDTIAVRLHYTNVVNLHADGTVTLDTGGWSTVTTKDRLNTYCPLGHVYSDRGDWFFYPSNGAARFLFFDGMTINRAGEVTNYDRHPWAKARQECEDARQQAREERAQRRAARAAWAARAAE